MPGIVSRDDARLRTAQSLTSRITMAAAAGYVVVFECERAGRWHCGLIDGPKGRVRGSGETPDDALQDALIALKMAPAPARPSTARHDYQARAQRTVESTGAHPDHPNERLVVNVERQPPKQIDPTRIRHG